jgi:outer membrane protein TolC
MRRTLFIAIATAGALAAQPLTMTQAVETALRNYPSIQVTEEQIAAAAAAIDVARAAYLPRIDTTAQVNRATRNNVFGMLLPQQIIPPLSGPVIGTNNARTAWGSAVGALVTWEPFDFGLRRATVATAAAAHAQSEASLKRTQYDIAVATADAFLTLAAAQETVVAARAGVERSETVARTIRALVNTELRPGADASRADAELAASRTQLIQAEQAVAVARTSVARLTGGEPAQIAIAAPSLARLPAEHDAPTFNPTATPVAMEQNAAIEQAKAQLHAFERSYFPRFFLQVAAYARGSGAETNGQLLGGANGLAPNVQNYALGFSVNFPVFDLASLHAREAQQSATIRSQSARARQIAVDLKAQFQAAVAMLEGARRVAVNTLVEIEAARAAARQATARYEAGLGNIDALAEAQRLVTQAEIDDALARLGVWRGLLAVAAAAGDIRPFLDEVGR